MISSFVKTATVTALAVDGNRLKLAVPASPYELPHADGGYVVLTEQSAISGSCTVTAAEIIAYSGYEADGVTLILTERGVGSTTARAWGVDTNLTQPLTEEELRELSPYYLWLDEGNAGTKQDFLNTLKGVDGQDGSAGATGTAGSQGISGAAGATGATGTAGSQGVAGAAGQSAYAVWLTQTGNSGKTEAQFFESLRSGGGIVVAGGAVNIASGNRYFLLLTSTATLNFPASGDFSVTWISGSHAIAINSNGKNINGIAIDVWNYQTASQVDFWFDATSNQWLCGN